MIYKNFQKLNIIILSFIFCIITVNAQELNYDLSDLGNLKGDDTVYIDTIIINELSNLNITADFWDADVEDEIGIRLNGTSYILYNNYIQNNHYVSNSITWNDLHPGAYILEGIDNYGKNQKWGLWHININISTQDLWGNTNNNGNNLDVYNLEEESVKIKLFKEKDDLEMFFKNISELYFLCIILLFLFFVFGKTDEDMDL